MSILHRLKPKLDTMHTVVFIHKNKATPGISSQRLINFHLSILSHVAYRHICRVTWNTIFFIKSSQIWFYTVLYCYHTVIQMYFARDHMSQIWLHMVKHCINMVINAATV